MRLLVAGICVCASFLPCGSFAQGSPNKPMYIVVGYPAGGAGDVVARMVAQKLSENLQQAVVVENRTGATGSIANEWVLKAPADGRTLLLLPSSGTILPALRALPYDLDRDFAPVSLLATGAWLLVVHPSVPATSIRELIELARLQPGKLTYGSAGVGSSHHLAGELFKSIAKINITHVPYKGAAEFVVANASGQIEISFPAIPAALPLINAGKLRALAVTTKTRASLMPSIPTLDELGLRGYDRSAWYGVLAPAAVPKDIIVRLNAAIGAVVNTAEMKDLLNKQGVEPQSSTMEQFGALVHNEIAVNSKLIKSIGARAE